MAWMFSPILLSMKSTFSMPTIDAVNTCKGEKCKNAQSSVPRAEALAVNHNLVHKKLKESSFGDCFDPLMAVPALFLSTWVALHFLCDILSSDSVGKELRGQ